MRNAILLIAFCSTLSAASISGLATASAQCVYVDAAGHGYAPTFSQSTDSGTVQDLCPATVTLPAPYFTVGSLVFRTQAAASVLASYGHLFGSTECCLSGVGGLSGQASVSAAYSDALTVTGAASGVVRFTFEIAGQSFSRPGFGGAPNSNHLIVNGSTVASLHLGEPVTTVTNTFDQPFISGIPIFFGADLSQTAINTVEIDSNHVDQFLRIQALDSLGAPLTGATVSFDSGGTYAAPEPSFAILVGMVLAIMEGIRRIRRS